MMAYLENCTSDDTYVQSQQEQLGANLMRSARRLGDMERAINELNEQYIWLYDANGVKTDVSNTDEQIRRIERARTVELHNCDRLLFDYMIGAGKVDFSVIPKIYLNECRDVLFSIIRSLDPATERQRLLEFSYWVDEKVAADIRRVTVKK